MKSVSVACCKRDGTCQMGQRRRRLTCRIGPCRSSKEFQGGTKNDGKKAFYSEEIYARTVAMSSIHAPLFFLLHAQRKTDGALQERGFRPFSSFFGGYNNKKKTHISRKERKINRRPPSGCALSFQNDKEMFFFSFSKKTAP